MLRFLTSRQRAARALRRRDDVCRDAAARAARAGVSRRHRQCPAARSQYLNLPDREEMLEFQRGSGARHCLEQRNSRFPCARVGARFINRRCGS